MNFDDTPQEAAFRAEAGNWIDANAPKEFEAELSKSSLGRIKLENEKIVDVGKAWQKKKAEAGWACLHWAKEYGGRGATPIERVIWQQEEGVYGKLTQPFQIGEGMCGPTVMAYGSEQHKRHYLPKLASGEQIWCQLFSEPAGGSDRKSTRLNSSHTVISYAVFCLKKKNKIIELVTTRNLLNSPVFPGHCRLLNNALSISLSSR